jgi:hypothetical protein
MKTILLPLVLIFAGLLAACSSGSSSSSQPPTLTSIAVTPANGSVPLGTLAQFTATGTYSNQTTKDLTASATWSSSNTSVATIASGGLATALATNATPVTITATSGTVSGNTGLTVANATVTSIMIEVPPGATSVQIANGTSYQFTALGFYNDGSRRNVTSLVAWSSSATNVATIAATTGRAQSVATGMTTITAALGSANGTVTLNVSPAVIASIVVGPSNPIIAPETTQQLTAIGTFNDGTAQNITHDVVWTSSKTNIATISNSAGSVGVATGVASGTTKISAAFGGVGGSAPLRISPVTVTSITLTPSSAGLASGSTLAMQAVAKFSDGTTQQVGTVAQWTSSDTTIASVDMGVVTGKTNGPVTITCQFGSASKTASLTVEGVTAIAISPGNPSLAASTSINLTATGTLTDGTTQNLTNSVQWTSSTTSVANMSSALGAAGLAIGHAPGSTTVTAAFSGLVTVTPLIVTNATLSSITIKPVAPNIALGSSQQFLATGTFSDSTTEDLTGQAEWSSTDLTVAIINDSGGASTTGTGTTTIEAARGTVNDSTVLTVH